MTRRLPPLASLRAFEAAARLLSLSKAAAELSVTPAAVSHQVKALEDWLGTPMFRRLNRAVLLTDAGQTLFRGLREGFDRLADAVESVRVQATGGPLTVSVAPSFASKWLVPRLERFRRLHPDIDVRIDASTALADFARDGVDLAVRYGPGQYPGLHSERLLGEEVSPVCSPALLDDSHPLREPADLRFHTLLHIDMQFADYVLPTWEMWLLAAGVRDLDWTRGPRFSVSSMALEAAIDGQGVALGSSVLAAADLAAGRLVKPFALALTLSFGYYVVVPAAQSARPKVTAFRDWLIAEAGDVSAASPA